MKINLLTQQPPTITITIIAMPLLHQHKLIALLVFAQNL
jgi:hypothetical protein